MADHWKCTACHHEWDGGREKCDWCGEPGEVIGKTNWPTLEEMRVIIDEMLRKEKGPELPPAPTQSD